jgi:uncharacterized membrane protein
MEALTIAVGLLCLLFIYVAFKHVIIHEKRDLKLNKRFLKNKKSKKKNK